MDRRRRPDRRRGLVRRRRPRRRGRRHGAGSGRHRGHRVVVGGRRAGLAPERRPGGGGRLGHHGGGPGVAGPADRGGDAEPAERCAGLPPGPGLGLRRAAHRRGGPVRRSVSRRRVLQLSVGAGLATLLPRVARAGSGRRRLLVYFNQGGWDTTQVFDPHFESSDIDRDPDAVPASAGDLAYAHADSRPSVQRFFEAHGHRCVVVNGIAVRSISHSLAARWMSTGTPSPDAPDVATIVAAHQGADLPLPASVVSGPRYPGTLGRYQVPLNHLLVAAARGELPAGAFDGEREARLRTWLLQAAERRLEQTGDARVEEYLAALQRRDALDEGLEGLDIAEDADADTLLDAAVQVLARGLSACASIQGEVPSLVGWDTHSDNDAVQDACYESAFATLHQLVDTLVSTSAPDGQPLIDSTTLLVISEMGRLPHLNAQQGKDHWPVTSCMVIGAGVARGRVVGATDGGLNSLPVDPDSGEATAGGTMLTSASLLAGLVERFDIDPAEFLPGTTPFRAPYAG
ncbi:MAG: DUF1501 domain-containing protein [Deltaproteobacteria bacterium]|nr:MAG: DUF1501 domain-containing protein [Deltaproteobacteria bacterium]